MCFKLKNILFYNNEKSLKTHRELSKAPRSFLNFSFSRIQKSQQTFAPCLIPCFFFQTVVLDGSSPLICRRSAVFLSLRSACKCALSSRPIRSVCACAAFHWAATARAQRAASKDPTRPLFAPPFPLSDRVILVILLIPSITS